MHLLRSKKDPIERSTTAARELYCIYIQYTVVYSCSPRGPRTVHMLSQTDASRGSRVNDDLSRGIPQVQQRWRAQALSSGSQRQREPRAPVSASTMNHTRVHLYTDAHTTYCTTTRRWAQRTHTPCPCPLVRLGHCNLHVLARAPSTLQALHPGGRSGWKIRLLALIPSLFGRSLLVRLARGYLALQLLA